MLSRVSSIILIAIYFVSYLIAVKTLMGKKRYPFDGNVKSNDERPQKNCQRSRRQIPHYDRDPSTESIRLKRDMNRIARDSQFIKTYGICYAQDSGTIAKFKPVQFVADLGAIRIFIADTLAFLLPHHWPEVSFLRLH